jgi:hypothetical protein
MKSVRSLLYLVQWSIMTAAVNLAKLVFSVHCVNNCLCLLPLLAQESAHLSAEHYVWYVQ